MKALDLFAALILLMVGAVTTAGAQTPMGDPPANADQAQEAPQSEDKSQQPHTENNGTSESLCLLIESAAMANHLPIEFFARVIWQESNFKPGAIGPTTRNGERAQGIAQFMPRTASERRLLDPFDPVQALPKSAEFLRDLANEFGNLGLSAAAYNAGPKRVHDWIDGHGTMPHETRHYVQAITGRPIEDWRTAGSKPANDHIDRPPHNCRELTALIVKTPNIFVEELQRRISEGASSPWGVQLSAGFSRNQVLGIYAALERRYRPILAGRDLSILKTKFLSRGTRDFYQVRVGENTRESADKLCTTLRAAGGPCMVLRNTRRL